MVVLVAGSGVPGGVGIVAAGAVDCLAASHVGTAQSALAGPDYE